MHLLEEDSSWRDAHWVTVWAAMPHSTEATDLPPEPYYADVAFYNATIRQTIRVPQRLRRIRVRLSNTFGSASLRITRAVIAYAKTEVTTRHAGSAAILPCAGQQQPLCFGGYESVDISAGATAVSDTIDLLGEKREILSISIYLRHGCESSGITCHSGSRTQTWICRGDHISTEDLRASKNSDLRSAYHWYFLSSVEALFQDSGACSVAMVGDSVTDGRCSTDDGNDRWPDLLADRMAHHYFARKVSVINVAGGGNRVLTDGKGPSLMSRLQRDVLAHHGVRYAVVFHGVNDIGTAGTDIASQSQVYDRLVQAYRHIVARCHSSGIVVFGATIGPFGDPSGSAQSYSTETRLRTRRRVNAWIRSSGVFDAVVDFDAVLRCSDKPDMLRQEFNSGDYLHPNVQAFKAMADSFPLGLFEEFQYQHKPHY